ncbi:hypothetical protein Tsubulata_046407 [Turnera subulata]|uniref:F-box/LRR-repeat protein 15/At3g58940/PEG3-like LRR domain-containing protein n=1 Tax=Turnera subulata TaxID=218843 RepID=A0A9Q0J2K3_9ROSI|nr:hypothetical protein Tsubulata_046407 [Turnera subulata]
MKKLSFLVCGKLGSLCSSHRSRITHSDGCTNADHDQVDRISKLPASVRAHILSFLPIKDAVKAMQLRCFGSLWASIDNLDLNLCLSHDCRIVVARDSDDFKFIDFVHQVLLLHQKSDIYRLHLSLRGLLHVVQLSYAIPSDPCPHSQELLKRETDLADMCIHFAMRKEVKILDLDFVAACQEDWLKHWTFLHKGMYKVSDCLFSCDSLQQLSLVYCRVVAPAGQICMKCLQTLYLRHVYLDDSTVENLISGCPLLENLSLIRCYGFQKLNFASPNLKYVNVFRHTSSGLEISGPHIKVLHMRSCLFRDFKLDNYSSALDVTLGLCSAPLVDAKSYEKYPGLRMMLEQCKYAQALTIEARILEVSEDMGDNMITPEVREGENGGSFKFVLNHLRIVRFHWWEMDFELFQLVRFVLMAARNLEKIVISPTPNFIYKIILLSLPRASPRAVMLFT